MSDKPTVAHYEPIDLRLISREMDMELGEVLDSFDRFFGGYVNYVRMCLDKDEQLPERLKMLVEGFTALRSSGLSATIDRCINQTKVGEP